MISPEIIPKKGLVVAVTAIVTPPINELSTTVVILLGTVIIAPSTNKKNGNGLGWNMLAYF